MADRKMKRKALICLLKTEWPFFFTLHITPHGAFDSLSKEKWWLKQRAYIQPWSAGEGPDGYGARPYQMKLSPRGEKLRSRLQRKFKIGIFGIERKES